MEAIGRSWGSTGQVTGQVPGKYRTSTGEVERIVLALEGAMKRTEISGSFGAETRRSFQGSISYACYKGRRYRNDLTGQTQKFKTTLPANRKGVNIKKSLEKK